MLIKKMPPTRALIGAWVFLLSLLFSPATLADGTLVIVGGALKKDNADVYRAFIDAAPPVGPLVIIPAASGQPSRSANGFADDLVNHGFDRTRISIFPLAMKDDTKSENVDESLWLKNAWSKEHLDKIANAAGFWFTGGDQTRITAMLVGENEEESPLLTLLRKRLADGAVIGGSSAGAAIMSREMIAGGDSFRALLEPLAGEYSSTEEQDSGRLHMSQGLGFMPAGIVDQHFDRKARLGRLVRAMAATGQARAYGVDENTALVINLESDEARVLGSGSVTLINATNAQFGFGKTQLVSGLELSVIAAGASFRLVDFEVVSGQGDATIGNEYYGYAPIQGGGMAFANSRLDQALGYDLLDNENSTRLKRFSVDHEGRILVYIFTQTPGSKGYWRREGSGEHYTLSKVRFDILNPQGLR